MSAHVIEGTWEEIERHKAELIGRHLRVAITPERPALHKRSAQRNKSPAATLAHRTSPQSMLPMRPHCAGRPSASATT